MEQCVVMWYSTKRRGGYRGSSTGGRLIAMREDGAGRLGSPKRPPLRLGHPHPQAHDTTAATQHLTAF